MTQRGRSATEDAQEGQDGQNGQDGHDHSDQERHGEEQHDEEQHGEERQGQEQHGQQHGQQQSGQGHHAREAHQYDPHASRQSAHTKQAHQRGRGPARWVSFGASVAVILALIALIVYTYHVHGHQQAIIAVQPHIAQVTQARGHYYLPMTVSNTGETTVENLLVQVSVTGSQPHESAQFTLRFLAGGQSKHVVVVLAHAPAPGTIHVDFVSFQVP